MNCSRCGNDVPAGAPVCPNCGTPLSNPAAPQATMFVPNYDPAPATSGMAIASFVVSLFGFLLPCISSVVALILGIVALTQINKDAGRLKGSGFAIAGIVISCSGIVMIPILASILFPVFSKARERARQTTCLSQQRQIAIAMQMYVQDNNGHYPTDISFSLSYLGDNPRLLHCPSDTAESGISYGYNSALRGVKDETITTPTTLLCLADGGNESHLIEAPTDINTTRHSQGYVAAFADGHAQYLLSDEKVQLTNDAPVNP